jgi:acetyl esterase
MTLDPMLAQMLAAAAGAPALDTLTPEEARAAMRARVAPLIAAAPPPPPVENFTCPGDYGGISLRLIRPEGDGPHPVVLFFHGGGWVVCDLDTHQPLAAAIARAANVAVLMVDYRLAPEHPFPAAIEDAEDALGWLIARGEMHGLNTDRVVLAGDSAGGNIAAVLARRVRDAGRSGVAPAIAGQWLIYPVTDLPDPQRHRSYIDNDGHYGLSTADMAWYWHMYAGSSAANADAIPMMADDLSGLAPALVQTAQYDVLRDEGEAYAGRMADAGVEVQLSRHPGMIHGFLSLAGMLAGADAALAEGAEWLRARLA